MRALLFLDNLFYFFVTLVELNYRTKDFLLARYYFLGSNLVREDTLVNGF